MTPLSFLVPGDLDLPTGGYTYDRRVLALLDSHGVRARHVPLPGSFPEPTGPDLDETVRIVAGLPSGDVLLVDGLALGAMPAATIRQFRRRLVALCHHPLCLEAGLSAERAAALRSTETQALALADAVVVTSPATRSLLVREFAVPAGKITVAVPGTDPAPRAQGTGSPLHLLAVGSVVPRKGYDVLVAALSGLVDHQWRLTIAGALDRSPSTVDRLRAAIDAAGLASRIDVAGAVESTALSLLYASADVFVMPSLFEGYGMVLGEAMARGLPIVCTTGGAAAETAPSEAALKVPPGDAEALRDALQRIMTDASLRQEMAKASWIAGQNLPRWEETARIIATAIKKVTA